MFKKILIANQGKITCHIATTARHLKLKTMTVYSDANTSTKHMQACNEAIHISSSAPKDSYLHWKQILQTAQNTNTKAMHPNYDFLNKNKNFTKTCATAKLVFIGPPTSAILTIGLKAKSKRLIKATGIPLMPSYHGADQDPVILQREANHINYPALIKANADNSNKNMHVVEKSEDFTTALASCQHKAINSFNSNTILIKKYIQRPHHIKIQVFGDTQGNYVYLFEHDYSVQHHHQKVLEKAPAPSMTETLHAQMGAATITATKTVNYINANTIKFIIKQTTYNQPKSMKFFFIKMNTHLQMKHPVTKTITSLDLVEWQLRVASNKPLPLRQDQLRIQSHTIKAHICTKNPNNNFLPTTSTLQVYHKPQASNFKTSTMHINNNMHKSNTINPFYNSIMAKLIMHGNTHKQALTQLNTALTQTHIINLNTNVQFLRHVVHNKTFATTKLDTTLIQHKAAILLHNTRPHAAAPQHQL